MIPNHLKTAEIAQVHKQGQLNLVDNYKPISILSVYSKLIEK